MSQDSSSSVNAQDLTIQQTKSPAQSAPQASTLADSTFVSRPMPLDKLDLNASAMSIVSSSDSHDDSCASANGVPSYVSSRAHQIEEGYGVKADPVSVAEVKPAEDKTIPVTIYNSPSVNKKGG